MDKKAFGRAGAVKRKQYVMPDGAEIEICSLSLSQRGEFQDAVKKDPIQAQAFTVCLSTVGLDEKDESDIALVNDMDGDVIDGLLDDIMELSGLSDKAVEDAEKNSQSDQN